MRDSKPIGCRDFIYSILERISILQIKDYKALLVGFEMSMILNFGLIPFSMPIL